MAIDFILRKEKWGGLLFNVKKRKYSVLDEAAFFIGKHLIKTVSADSNKTIEAYSSQFQISKGTAKRDFLKIKRSLTSCGVFKTNTRIIDKKIRKTSFPLQAPLYVDWYITSHCNLNCRFCFLDKRFWSTKDACFTEKSFIADQLIESGIFEVTLLGGEPLLILEEVFNLTQKLIENGIRVDISTNGLLFQKQLKYFIKKFRSINSKETLTISVSIPSVDKALFRYMTKVGDGCSDLLISIERILQEGIPVAATTVLTKFNLQDIPNIYRKISQLGMKNYTIFYPYTAGDNRNAQKLPNKKEFLKVLGRLKHTKKKFHLDTAYNLVGAFNFLWNESGELRRNLHNFDRLGMLFCKGGMTKLDILPNGTVVPCILLTDAYWRLGQMPRDRIQKIWSDSNKLLILRKRKQPEKCINCKWSESCKGGCIGESYKSQGNIEEPDPRCFFFQKQSFS